MRLPVVAMFVVASAASAFCGVSRSPATRCVTRCCANSPDASPVAAPLDKEVAGVVEPINPFLAAPGEAFKKAVYTKADAPMATGLPDDDDEPFPVKALPYVSPALDESEELRQVLEKTRAAVSNFDVDAQEAYGDWCREPERQALIAALDGLRGRKLVWWLDAPKPVRSVLARDPKHEISIVGLPSGMALPPAAFPRGSIIFCVPLLGQFTVRRLRFDITGKVETPIELMKRTLKFGGKPQLLAGGSCHEFVCAAGATACFLQVVMLPPTSNLPARAAAADGSIGWRRPPGEVRPPPEPRPSASALALMVSRVRCDALPSDGPVFDAMLCPLMVSRVRCDALPSDGVPCSMRCSAL
jgi:hypothetical protein